ncbi:hypothetical protein GGF32_003985 [Allomyces javanicus]|nr:hypothetical protein GGF32_003985 [Allomyces javanicus]
MATQPDYPPTAHLGTRRPVTPDAARRRRAVVRAQGSTTTTTIATPPVPRADAPPPPPASLALPLASYPWLTPPPLFTSTSTTPDHHHAADAYPPVLPFPYPPLPPPPAPSATGGPSLSLSAGSTLANNNSSAASLTLPALADLGSTPLHPLAPPRAPRSASTPAVIPLVSRAKTAIPPPVPAKDAHWVSPAPDIARYHSAPTVPRIATGSPDRRLVPARDHVRIMRTGTPPLPRPTLPDPRHPQHHDDEDDDDDADVSAMPAISLPTRSAADERARLMHAPPGGVPPSGIPPAAEPVRPRHDTATSALELAMMANAAVATSAPSAPTSDASTAVAPNVPDYALRVPVVYGWTFHDLASPAHYAGGCVPFTLPMYPHAPPTLVPVRPRTFRLDRDWSRSGEHPSFRKLSTVFGDMAATLDEIRAGALAAAPAGMSAHAVQLAKVVAKHLGHPSPFGDGNGSAVGSSSSVSGRPEDDYVKDVDDAVERINGMLLHGDRVSRRGVMDTVLGVLTGWAHHLCLPVPYESVVDDVERFLDRVNTKLFHPRKLHLRNPFDNGLMFLEIEVLDR